MSGPTPQQLALPGTEHAHQVALFCWAALNFERWPDLRLMFAIPNGGLRDKVVAANLKAEGVRAGVSDIMLPIPKGGYHGFFLELKVGKNKPSNDQLKFMADVKERGFIAHWFVGWESAAKAITWYMEL